MSPSPGDNPDRTIPEWLDPQNLHGKLYYLILRPSDGHTLPNNPFLIGRSVEKHAGKIEGAFFDHNKKWYVLKIRNKDQGRHLILLKQLEDGTPIVIGRHPSLNQRKCVVRCPEVDGMTEDDLTSELKSQNIVHVRRITKKTAAGIVGTPTLVLTIDSTVIPEYINFGLLKVRTRVYIPQPLLCRLCFKYGHPKKRCTNAKVCSICCSASHESNTCQGTKFCHTCQSSTHSPSDRNCPKWILESTVLQMSVEKNLTPAAARQIINTNSSAVSYAEITRSTKLSTSQKPAPHTSQQHRQEEEKRLPAAAEQPKRTSSLAIQSPPRKKCSPSRAGSSNEAVAHDTQEQKLIVNAASRLSRSSNNLIPSPSSPPNPFQPPQHPSFKIKITKPTGS